MSEVSSMKPTTVKVGGGRRCLHAYLRDLKVWPSVFAKSILQKVYSVCIRYSGGAYLQASLISIFTAHKCPPVTHSVVSDQEGDV